MKFVTHVVSLLVRRPHYHEKSHVARLIVFVMLRLQRLIIYTRSLPLCQHRDRGRHELFSSSSNHESSPKG